MSTASVTIGVTTPTVARFQISALTVFARYSVRRGTRERKGQISFVRKEVLEKPDINEDGGITHEGNNCEKTPLLQSPTTRVTGKKTAAPFTSSM